MIRLFPQHCRCYLLLEPFGAINVTRGFHAMLTCRVVVRLDTCSSSPPNEAVKAFRKSIGQLSLQSVEIHVRCVCTMPRLDVLATACQPATIVKPLAAPRLHVLVWRRHGLVPDSKTGSLLSIRPSEAICLRWRSFRRGKQHFFDAIIDAMQQMARGEAVPRVNACQVGMPV